MSLEVEVRHRQGAFALDVAFRSEGRLTALFGRSGSGKTTLVNAIAGLVRPSEGRIAVDGTVLLATGARVFVPKHRRRIGYVFQEGRLLPHLTVRQNMLLGRWLAGRQEGTAAGAAEVDRVVEMLGVGPLLSRRPGGLSGGEKQRVAIGRALLSYPRLLLMDEPLASLDEARKSEILPYIERLRDEFALPIIYVSHSVAEVARLATTVVVLDGGRVAASGPVSEVMGGRLGIGPLRAERRGGTALDARVVAHQREHHLTHLSTPAGPLVVPHLDRTIGAKVRLLVSARDVMVSLDRPGRISALNVLPGTVVEVDSGEGAWRELRLRCGEADLIARVTLKSVAELGLVPGVSVYALIKSASLEGGVRP